MPLIGCGGGGTSTSTTPAALSQQQFVARADAACATANQEIEALPALPSPPDLQSVASFVSSIQPIAQDLLTKLQQLQPPAPEQDKYTTFLSEARDAFGKFASLRDAAESGDVQKTRSIADGFNANPPGNVNATDLGLTECAKNAQPQG